MIFLEHITFFSWLIAAGLPVLLYWLFRRRRSVVEWSANYILRQTLKKEGKKNTWKQIVILALRTLLIILLILALAKPFIPETVPEDTIPHGDGSLHQVILIDNSRSMLLPYNSISRDEELRFRLDQLLKRLQYGDYCDLIFMAGNQQQQPLLMSVKCPLTQEQEEIINKQLKPVEQAVQVQRSLQLAAERFSVTSSANRQLFILSDFNQRDYAGLDDLTKLASIFNGQNVDCVAYQIRQKEYPNVAIENIVCGVKQMLAGLTYHVQAELCNYGRTGKTINLKTVVKKDDKTIFDNTQVVELKANERKIVNIPFNAPNEDGLLSIKASFDDGSYGYDNQASIKTYVTPRLRVALVYHDDEDQIKRPLWRESRYIQNALEAMDKNNPSGYLLKRIKSNELSPQAINESDVIVFCGVSSIKPECRSPLKQFVNQGGGILFGTGETVYADTFNESFAGIAPELVKRHSAIQRDRMDWDYESAYMTIAKTFSDPLLRRYLQEDEGPIENVRIYNYFKCNYKGNVLINLNNGDPLLISTAIGRGQVLTFTSSLGGSWSSMPVRNMYHNLIYAWIGYLSGFKPLEQNIAMGMPIIIQSKSEQATVIRPDMQTVELKPQNVMGKTFFRYDDINTPGVYQVKIKDQRPVDFDVKETVVESDTTPLSRDDEERFKGQLGVFYSAAWSQLSNGIHAEEHHGWNPMGIFLIAALICFCLDAVLTWRWFK